LEENPIWILPKEQHKRRYRQVRLASDEFYPSEAERGKNGGLAALRSTFHKILIPPWVGKDRNTSQVYWDCTFSRDSVGFKEHTHRNVHVYVVVKIYFQQYM